MVRRSVVLACLLFAACDARIGGVDNGIDNNGPDASTGGGTGGDVDAPSGTPTDAPACSSRVVYLDFGTPGSVRSLSKATTSNSKMNTASWIGKDPNNPNVTSANLPAFHANDTNRQALIDSIVASVTSQLSNIPVTVVTTRPTSGDYVMVVFGGTNTQLGTKYTYATNELDCGDLNRNDVAWMSDTTPTAKVDDYTLGAIGFGLGLTAVDNESDCMCGWANGCHQPETTQCTFTAGTVTRDNTGEQSCAGLTSQDENATLHKAFCE